MSAVRYDRLILRLALLIGLPGSMVALLLLWFGEHSLKVQWTLTLFIVGLWVGLAFSLRERVVLPLQTISNLLAALREGDYSIRARGGRRIDPLGEAILEVNALGETLRTQRLGALEATALLRTVMEEIEVAVYAFDAEQRLRLVNREGARLLGQPSERLLGRTAAQLGLAVCLAADAAESLQLDFPGAVGRFGLRRSTFREGGKPHDLVVLADLSRALREEERQAWQRLIRVLGHELNNSLATIKSMSGSLESLIAREPRPADWQEDTQRALRIISARAEALSRFMAAYTRLARLPPPSLHPVAIGDLVRRVVGFEGRLPVLLQPGPEVIVRADADQLEQALINLVRNAVDACLETRGRVTVGWKRAAEHVEIRVEDEGPGLSNTANLFVPFFTTKPEGSGIGLLLSRQIAEAHGGSLTLENRRQSPGCEARLRLPLQEDAASRAKAPPT